MMIKILPKIISAGFVVAATVLLCLFVPSSPA
jgi:hypothetical protein